MIDVKDKKIFLSGPMSGVPQSNIDKFCKLHMFLLEQGAQEIYNPALELLWTKDKGVYKERLRESIHELTKKNYATQRAYYDMIIILPESTQSIGSDLETKVADKCGIKIIPSWELDFSF